MRRIQVIDSHTGGEPTRCVISGFPDLGEGTLAQRREVFRDQFDMWRSAIVNEPRGSDVIVGALLCPPRAPDSVAGVIFFNNVGPLYMCGHGTIGVAVTLAHLGRIQPGQHKLETPVGDVPFEYHGDHKVTLENVPSYRYRAEVSIEVPEIGTVVGDIAWGGNWFFLVKNYQEPIHIGRVDRLLEVSRAIQRALREQGITGENGGEIDHVELFGEPGDPANDSRNFVLCPGGAYDRSPCGTGTSAKLACLAADGKLKPGAIWRQESVLGSVFEGSYRLEGDRIIPRISGTAYVNAEAVLLLDPQDPFEMGIRSI